MAKVVCRPEGLTAKGKLKPGYRYAKKRKGCPIKAKGAPRNKAKVGYGRTQGPRPFAGAKRRRRAKK